MATKRSIQQRKDAPKKRAEEPVSDAIRRAAKRAGIPADDAMAEIAKAMEARVEAFAVLDEVKALRELAARAESMFEGEGLGPNMTREEVLSEALICARADLDLLQDGAGSGCGVDSMMFVRAKHRIDFALKLAEYRGQFGSKAVTQ